jgi:hypothetical protein
MEDAQHVDELTVAVKELTAEIRMLGIIIGTMVEAIPTMTSSPIAKLLGLKAKG